MAFRTGTVPSPGKSCQNRSSCFPLFSSNRKTITMTLDDSDIETGEPAFPNGNRFLRRKRCVAELFGLLAEGDYAKGAVVVAVGAGGEEKLVVLAVGTDILTKLQGPDIVDFDGFIAGVAKRAEETASL